MSHSVSINASHLNKITRETSQFDMWLIISDKTEGAATIFKAKGKC